MFEIALVRSIERAVGQEGLGRVLALAGLSDDDLVDDLRALSHVDKILRIAEASTLVTGDPDPGWRAGEELMRIHRIESIHVFIRASGGPVEALTFVADYATKSLGEHLVSVAESGDDRVVLDAVHRGSEQPHPFFCRMQASYYSQVPNLFGATGAVAETRCVVRGDDRCRFEVTWEGTTKDQTRSAVRSRELINRFEELHNIASELALAPDVDTALDRIVDRVRAGTAVSGLGFLLAARLTPDAPLRVHHRGLTAEEAREAAALVGAGELDDRFGQPVVAEIESATTKYGHLVAFFPAGTTITDIDRRLLGAYAAHATAALEAAHTLEQARRDRDTAQALLGLAHSLARARTVKDVAHRITEILPAVVAAKDGAVWFWDEESSVLRPVSRVVRTPEANPALRIPQIEHQRLDAVVRGGKPVIAEIWRMPEHYQRLMASSGAADVAFAPILARSDFLGVLAAAFPLPIPPDQREEVLDRLAALAEQAAAALDNVRLVERVRHQALHDTLTGLPNRVLVEDRVRQTLERVPRGGPGAALLFVDVDRFKAINDSLGHDAGDELLRMLGARFGTCLRATDTLARIGGDEFLVFVPGTSDPRDASAVAEKLTTATREPLDLQGHDVQVTISVGIALAPTDGANYETLLRRADAAMYAAKAAGRDCYRFHGDGAPS